MYLPQVTNNRGICPGMLSVQSHCAILENYQVEGFIKPPDNKESENEIQFMVHKQKVMTYETPRPLLSHLS